MESTTERSNVTSSRATTRELLACGLAAGPLFYEAAIQAFAVGVSP